MDQWQSHPGFVLDSLYSDFGSDDLFVPQPEQSSSRLHVENKDESALSSKPVKTTSCAYDLFDKMFLKGIKEKQQSMHRNIPKSWRFKFKQGGTNKSCHELNINELIQGISGTNILVLVLKLDWYRRV
uniref:Uncharacterized protein n=1 Tax=Noccaea caerulescens TaxID=107243 RepID=A0A1J3FWJ1_NOCCA